MSAPLPGEYFRVSQDSRSKRIGWWVVLAFISIIIFLAANSANAQNAECPDFWYENQTGFLFRSSFLSTGIIDPTGHCQVIFQSNGTQLLEERWFGSGFVSAMNIYAQLEGHTIEVTHRCGMWGSRVHELVELTETYIVEPFQDRVSFTNYNWEDTEFYYLSMYNLATIVNEYGKIVVFLNGNGCVLVEGMKP